MAPGSGSTPAAQPKATRPRRSPAAPPSPIQLSEKPKIYTTLRVSHEGLGAEAVGSAPNSGLAQIAANGHLHESLTNTQMGACDVPRLVVWSLLRSTSICPGMGHVTEIGRKFDVVEIYDKYTVLP